MALPPEVLQSVRDTVSAAKAKIPELEADINKARLAGLDVTAYVTQLNTAKDQLRKLEAQYGSA